MPVMHTAIPCTSTGSTADQAVSTVHLQLGAAKHLTRTLTKRTSCVGRTMRTIRIVAARLDIAPIILLKYA